MREYLPTLSELIDRLSICQLKEVKISDKKTEYGEEIKQIISDINKIIVESDKLEFSGELVRAIVVLSQMNTHIWVNEDNARNGDDKENQLLLTHGLNGIRNTAKNKIQESLGGRKDYKIDCIASEFKDWEVSWGAPLSNNKWIHDLKSGNPGGFSIQVYQKKDSDFQIITSTKCATRWLDAVTLVRDGEKKCIKSRFWELITTENDRWRWFEINFFYEWQIQMNAEEKEKEIDNLKHIWNFHKSDTLLLYRDPYKRIKSGILQKYNSWYKDTPMTDEKQLKLFKKDLRILEDNFVDLFTKLHQRDTHCHPWSSLALHLINDLNLNPRIYVNLDIQENSVNQDLTKWLKAVCNEEEIERVNDINDEKLQSNRKIYDLIQFNLEEKLKPLITAELQAYNILEQKRSKL